MGVPGYFAAARRLCPSAVAKRGESQNVPLFDALYVDFNCLVHNAVESGSTDSSVIERTMVLLDRLIEYVAPTVSVHVCADGVPPEAKMNQQRNRRFMASKSGECTTGFDKNKITPGSLFNARLDREVRERCACVSAERSVQVTYSGTDEPGEGEQKILSRIRTARQGGSPACVYGLDADLVLLCGTLAAQGLDVPWLCREEHSGENDASVTFVDARKLVSHVAGGGDARSLWNHVVCSFLCGNDFLPPLSCLDMSRETGWLLRLRKICNAEELSLVRTRGTGEAGIDWDAFASLMASLSDTEDSDFREADRRYWSARPPPSSCPSDEWDNLPLLQRDEALRSIRPGDPDWRTRFYSSLFYMRNPSGIARVVFEFVRGIEWTFRYYSGAFPPPIQPPAWSYRFSYGPTSLDVFNYVSACGGEPPATDLCETEAHPVTPQRLLCYVTPLASEALVSHACINRRPRHLFPSDCKVSTYLRRKIWHCKAELPHARSYDVVLEDADQQETTP